MVERTCKKDQKEQPVKVPFEKDNVKIAVIGGGTGSFMLLSALKNHTSRIAALVNMADDGGSTGQLRDELGVLPPGDVRQCLVALSNSPKVRELFNYRFDDGGMKGHAFGNLFLTALEKMTGNFGQAVELAGEVLSITGMVEPLTMTNVTLVHDAPDGKEVRGEFEIAHCEFADERPALRLDPKGVPSERALEAIKVADMVVIAPGNLYGSLAPALLVDGIGEALAESKAVKVYVCNLVTKPGQTDDFYVHDFADEIERLAGRPFLDVVMYNTEPPSDDLMQRYAKEGEKPVLVDEKRLDQARYKSSGCKLLADKAWSGGSEADPIASARTLIRHDSEAVAHALMELYDELKAK
jgi:uncharacterized cofD-like protein